MPTLARVKQLIRSCVPVDVHGQVDLARTIDELEVVVRTIEALQRGPRSIVDRTPVPSQTEYEDHSLMLTGYGPNKIEVIKAVRLITNLSFVDSKDLVDRSALKNQLVTTGNFETLRIAERQIVGAGGQAFIA
jgi:ribosomal protein L7/L12